MATYTLYGAMATGKAYSATGTTYPNARNATGGVGTTTLSAGITRVQNGFGGTTYTVAQSGYRYDLTTVVGDIAAVSLVLVPNTGNSGGAGVPSIQAWYNSLTGTTDTTGLFLTGTQLDASTPATAAVAPVTVGATYATMQLEVTTPSLLDRTGLAWLTLAHGGTGANTTPTAESYLAINTQDAAGTVDDPYMFVRSGHTVRDVGNAATTSAGNVAVSYPPVLAANDALVVSLVASDNVVSTMPAGWTLKSATNNGTALRQEIWWARAAGSETGSVTITRSAGAAASARMIAVTGGNTSGDPIAAVYSNTTASATTVITGAAPTAATGALATIVAAAVADAADLSHAYTATQQLSAWSSSAFEEYDDKVEPRAYLVDDVAANNSGGATTLSFIVPATAAVGDVLIAWVTVRGTTTTVTRSSPAWTLHDSLSDGTNAVTRLLWYVIPASGGDQPGSTVTFTLGTSQKASGAMAVMRNANTTAPFNASARQANASSVNCTVPTITPSASGTLSLVYGGTAIGTTANTSPTSGFSPISYELAVQGASSANQANTRTTSALYAPIGTTTGRQTSGSAIGSGVLTFAAAATNVGWHIAVASADATRRPVAHGMATFNVTGTDLSAQSASLSRAAVNIGSLVVFAPQSSSSVFSSSVAASVTATTTAVERAQKTLGGSSTFAAAVAAARNTLASVVASLTGTAAIAQSRQVVLTPDSTTSNTGWVPVNAATVHGALASSDSDYIRSISAGSVTEVTLSDPTAGSTFTSAQLTLRVRLG